MICLQCDGQVFETRIQTCVQEYKGHTITTEGPAETCVKCGYWTFNLEQLDRMVKATKGEYLNRQARTP